MSSVEGSVAGVPVLSRLPDDLEPLLPWLRSTPTVAGTPVVVARSAAARTVSTPPIAHFGPVSLSRVEQSWVLSAATTRVEVEGDCVRVHAERVDRAAAIALAIGLRIALRARGAIDVHAGLATLDAAGMLVVGGSGTGKTTLTSAIAMAGGYVATDDEVYLTQAPQLRAWGLPRAFHMAPRTLDAIGARAHVAAGLSIVERESKSVVHPEDVWPRRTLRDSVVPRLVLVTSIASQLESTSHPLDPQEALAALLGSSGLTMVTELPGSSSALDAMSTLASTVPARRLTLGADLLLAPAQTAARLCHP